MRIAFGLALTATLLAPSLVLAAALPSSYLRYGQSSPEVVLLQQALNASPQTQIAAEGPGAPGQETSYFGALTLSAVKRFQALNGVPTTGYVGPLTLAALAQAAASPAPVAPSSSSAPAAGTTGTPIPAVPAAQVYAPGSPLEQYIAAVRQQAVQNGASATTTAYLEQKIRDEAATTTDFMAQFYKEQQDIYLKEHHVSFLEGIFSKLGDVFAPAIARAALALPFGGKLVYVNPFICDCSPGLTQVFVALPNPTPTSNLLLLYVDGTEAFQWHNLPEPGVNTLGEYTPGGVCFTIVSHACIPIPAEGVITPLVGSSAIPSV